MGGKSDYEKKSGIIVNSHNNHEYLYVYYTEYCRS